MQGFLDRIVVVMSEMESLNTRATEKPERLEVFHTLGNSKSYILHLSHKSFGGSRKALVWTNCIHPCVKSLNKQ